MSTLVAILACLQVSFTDGAFHFQASSAGRLSCNGLYSRVMCKVLVFLLFFVPVVIAEDISADRRNVRISNGRFIVQGIPTFLLGISYYDGMNASTDILRADFAFLKARGFNSIRVWATWYESESPQSLPIIRRNGTINPAGWNRLERLLNVAKANSILIDLTFSRDSVHPISFENYKNAIRLVTAKLKPYPRVLMDIQNETNTCGLPEDPDCSGHLTLNQVALIRAEVKGISPTRLVTASRNTYSILPGKDDYRTYKTLGRVDFIATHRPSRTRDAIWAHTTDDEVRLIRKALGPSIPILFDEPNRCGKNMICDTLTSANIFINAAANAKRAGAAGWFFHTDAGFRLRNHTLAAQLNSVERSAVDRLGQILSRIH